VARGLEEAKNAAGTHHCATICLLCDSLNGYGAAACAFFASPGVSPLDGFATLAMTDGGGWNTLGHAASLALEPVFG
jgi:hypothetical protein